MFLFNLLLFNVCLTANTNKDSSRSNVQNQDKSENGNKTNAFNEDFEYAMFDSSDLKEIVEFAKLPRVSEHVKKHIFPVKYQNYAFHMGPIDGNDPQDDVSVSSKSLYIYGYNLCLELIKLFGQSIQRLNIYDSNFLNEGHSAVLHEYVNKYCADSLVFFHLTGAKSNTLTQFKKPFSLLEALFFRIQINQAEPVRPKIQ